jgi:broad specificity phosphatase PhoE
MKLLRVLSIRVSVLVALLALPAFAYAADKIVILVRHAEKETGKDPGLTPTGVDRAEALNEVLSYTEVDHVIVTQWQRTQETAEPVLLRGELEAQVVQTDGGLARHVSAVAVAVRDRPGEETILVVGHSDTIPAIVAALGGPELPDLEEKSEYATLFVLVLPEAGEVRLIRSRYGPVNPGRSEPSK